MKTLGAIVLLGGIYFVAGFAITAGMTVGLEVAGKFFEEKEEKTEA